MKTAQEIVDFVGAATLADSVGVKPDAVRVALTNGKLPSAWYAAAENLAGRPLPRDCFTFKGVAV